MSVCKLLSRGFGRADIPVCFLDRALDRVDVERTNTTEVDDLCLDALLRQNLRSLERVRHHLAVRDDRDVRPLQFDLGLANR